MPENVGISTVAGVLTWSTIPKNTIIGIVTYVRARAVAITGLQRFTKYCQMYRQHNYSRTVVHIGTNRKKRCEQARTLEPLQSLGCRDRVGCGESQQNMCARTDPFPP